MSGLNQLKRNLSDLTTDPRAYLEMVADRMRNSVMGQRAVAGDQGAGMVQLTPEERRAQVQGAMLDNSGQGAMGGALGIIKGKGGNWLNGTVENALSGLKRSPVLYADLGAPAVANPQAKALNNWIEGPLTKYIKRDMATEGDPVRKLAEQGVLHATPEQLGINLAAYVRFPFAGQTYMAKNPTARVWEAASDSSVESLKRSELSNAQHTENPWLQKTPPDSEVYSMADHRSNRDLGFDHLTDELSNALNPESGLPRQLLLTPEQMQQMGMEKAVRHVADINAWRAAQKAEANAKLAQSPAVHGVREYAENNPKGLRWVELKQPAVESDLPYGSVGDPAAEARRHIQEQLKYEGDTMGHCVGGYCDDVVSGKSRIYSLRDAKGEPHVTIESSPGRWNKDYAKSLLDPTGKFETFDDLVHNSRIGNGDYDRVASELADTHGIEKPPQQIIQIKGKQNKKPNDEYLPFVQDFVKNHPEGGQWGDVGDFGNTGLIKHSGKRAEALGPYSTEEELTKYLDQFPDTTQGYAEGGTIREPQWEQLEGGYILR